MVFRVYIMKTNCCNYIYHHHLPFIRKVRGGGFTNLKYRLTGYYLAGGGQATPCSHTECREQLSKSD